MNLSYVNIRGSYCGQQINHVVENFWIVFYCSNTCFKKFLIKTLELYQEFGHQKQKKIMNKINLLVELFRNSNNKILNCNVNLITTPKQHCQNKFE